MNKHFFAPVFLLLALVGIAGAESVTWTKYAQGTVKMYEAAWSTNSTGTVNATIQDMPNGQIVGVVFAPSLVAHPANNYDVYIFDDLGRDVLGGAGVNCSNSTLSSNSTLGGPLGYSPLHFGVVNAGAGAESRGTVRLYVR